jgi:threonine dehydrogenase-like Zn-dependent dehydrogenase
VRAVRLVEARRLEPIELPDPKPGPGEVVLRVVACGICGSDLSCYKTGVFAGSVLGHELAGVIEEIGPGVERWSEGDPVAVDPKIPCGTCEDCLAGAPTRCLSSMTDAIGMTHPGGFAERVLVQARSLLALPTTLPVENGCLVEPLSVALHGLARADAGAEPAVVIGLGPIGLLSVAALAARRAPVIGIDPVAGRRDLAARVGAEATFAPGNDANSAAFGRGLVLECSGRPDAIQTAANLAGGGGRIVLLGISMAEATIHPTVWTTRELTLLGCIQSSEADFRDSIELLAREPGIAEIITRRVPIEDVPAAFEDLLTPAGDGKIAVDPSL